MSDLIMKRTIATIAVLVAGIFTTITAASPVQAAVLDRCVTGSTKTDAVMASSTLRASVTSTRYRLPNGQTIVVTRTTDPMTAAYAAARAVEVQVCIRTGI